MELADFIATKWCIKKKALTGCTIKRHGSLKGAVAFDLRHTILSTQLFSSLSTSFVLGRLRRITIQAWRIFMYSEKPTYFEKLA